MPHRNRTINNSTPAVERDIDNWGVGLTAVVHGFTAAKHGSREWLYHFNSLLMLCELDGKAGDDAREVMRSWFGVIITPPQLDPELPSAIILQFPAPPRP